MMGEYRVSVVIPVYNRSDLLLRALASVYMQTLKPVEVIVVDDGSNCSLRQLLLSHYPKVKYVRQPNLGVSTARNNGVAQSTGNWIAFLDSDDEWHPKKLEQQAHSLSQSGLLVSHTNEIWLRHGVRVNPHNKHKKYGGDIFIYCLELCLMSPSSVLIYKDLFNKLGGFDESLKACEDYDLWLRLSANNMVDFVDELLVTKYGGHADQLSQKYWGMDRFRIYSLEKFYNSNEISVNKNKTIALLNVLVNKCTVFANGARKRQNKLVYRDYSKKIEHYKLALAKLMS